MQICTLSTVLYILCFWSHCFQLLCCFCKTASCSSLWPPLPMRPSLRLLLLLANGLATCLAPPAATQQSVLSKV
jgi:hypothetical protein